jgi:hypothetical protein
MVKRKKIPIILTMGIFFMNVNHGVGLDSGSPQTLFETAQKEICRLNFNTAYGFLSEIPQRYPHSSWSEKAIILKNIISLSQTFSNLRLYSAYNKGRSLYGEESAADSLSPPSLLEPYTGEYLKRTKNWAKKLDLDRKESLKISKDTELSITYPGSQELPYFIKIGIDTMENIKKGIPPTPSQAQNIEEFEGYAGFLSAIYLCMEKKFKVPQKTILIKGKVIPKLLLYYSNLWINKVLALTGAQREITL